MTELVLDYIIIQGNEQVAKLKYPTANINTIYVKQNTAVIL